MIPISLLLSAEDSRLTLRAFSFKDAWTMFDAFHFPDFTKGLRYAGPLSLFQVYCDIARVRLRWRRGNAYFFAIVVNGRCVGRVHLVSNNNDWHLGYWLHPAFQGKGYLREAISILIPWARGALHIEEMHASCHSWNQKSRKALLGSGFTILRTEDVLEHYVKDLSLTLPYGGCFRALRQGSISYPSFLWQSMNPNRKKLRFLPSQISPLLIQKNTSALGV